MKGRGSVREYSGEERQRADYTHGNLLLVCRECHTLVSRKRAKIGARAGPIWHYVAQGAPYMYARIQPGPAPVARTQSRCSAKNASVRSLASFALSAS